MKSTVLLLVVHAAAQDLFLSKHDTGLSQKFVTDFPKRLPNGSFPGGDDTGVFITSLDQIPRLPADAEGEIFYMEAGIPVTENISTDKFSVYHSGIGVAFHGKGWQYNMTVQWYAQEGMGNAIIPGPDGKWHNEAVLVLSPSIDQGYWTKQTRAGAITGAIWNQHAEFLVSYAFTHRAYQFLRVELADGSVEVPEQICDSFSEDSLHKFQDLGCKMDPATPLRRNYVSLVAKEKPTLVDMSNTTQVREVAKFYKNLYAQIEKWSKASKEKQSSLTLYDIVKFYNETYAGRSEDMVGYVGNPAFGGVFRVVSSGPQPFRTGYSQIPLK